MTKRINQSWREQRKAVICHTTDGTQEFPSLWQAALWVAEHNDCKHETAKKEIRRAIKTGCKRYGCMWRWKDDD